MKKFDFDRLGMAREVINKEAEAVREVSRRLNESFLKALDMIYSCKGKVIVTGIGKSGLIAKKIAATLTSTGTPAIFLHPAEGLHGDLGILAKNDIVLAVSNSGETPETINILPTVRMKGVPLIALVGNTNSTLAKRADVVIDFHVKEEASELELLPTSSTTACLALGDALAIVLMKMRNFNDQDYAIIHPGGTIGRQLLTTVEDLMHTDDELPLIDTETLMRDALFVITSKGLGVTGVLDDSNELVGVITDGDLRRGLEKNPNMLEVKAREIMTTNPKWIQKDELAAKALNIMENFSITSLFVFEDEKKGRPIGIIHIHDILKAGIG